MPWVLCLGHAAQDYIYRVPAIPTRPVKVVATAFSECGGGMAANAAVAIARLGGEAEYWGRVADDALGQRILDELRAEGVIVDAARRIAGCRSPATSILIADDGERLICSFADPSLDQDPAWLPIERVPAFDAVLADVRWPRGSGRLLDAARAAGRPALLDADVGSLPDVLDLVGRASHVLFSAAGLDAIAPGERPFDVLRRLRQRAHALVGVTLGSSGFAWIDDEGEHLARAPEIRAVDTLAAGDVWHGAFALAIAEGRGTDAAARFANAAAAIKCQRPGGRSGAPSRQEVDDLIRLQRK
jgi:sulfofructose kinase